MAADPVTVGGDLRARKKARTRQDLIDHALRLFTEQGYEATTVEQIVAAADYSRRTFFHHFAAKEDVVFADVEDFFDRLRVRLELAPPDADPWRVVGRVLKDLTRESYEDPSISLAGRMLWHTEPALAGRYHTTLMGWESVIARFIADRDGVDLAGGSDAAVDVAVTAAAVIAALRVCVRHEVLDGGDFPAAFVRAYDLVDRGVARHRRR